jgi:hypothetical protein
VSSVYRHTSFLYIAGLAAGAALILLAILLVNPQTLGGQLSWIPATCALILWGFLGWGGMRWLKASFPNDLVWLHPPFLITVWGFVALGLPGWYSFLDQTILASSSAIIDYTFGAWGMLLMVAGILCIWLGYALSAKLFSPGAFVKRLARSPIDLKVVMLFFAVTVIAQLIQIRVAGVAYGADQTEWGEATAVQLLVGYLKDIGSLVLAILAVKVFQHEWPIWPLALVVVVQILFGFVSGFMKPIFWLGVILVLAAMVARVRLKRFIWPMIVLVILGLLVVPVAEGLRNQADLGQYDSRSLSEVADATGVAIQNVLSRDLQSNLEQVINRFLFRQTLVAQTPGIIILRTPSFFPYLGWEQFLAIPTYLIPRAFWPDKPELSKGNWFAITYLNEPSFTTSSAAITVFGEGYMIAGWAGTLLVCVILGFLLGFIYQKLAASGLIFVYLALVPTFMDIEGQFTGILVALIQKLVIFLIVYWVIVMLSARSATHPTTAQPAALQEARRF